MRFEKKVAVVTGGAAGIGRAAAGIFAAEGASVVIAGRSEEKGLKATGEIEASGARALFVKTDISREGDVKALMRKALDAFGSIDVLVNNASSFIFRSVDATVEEWREILGVNVSSISAHIAQPGLLTYNTTKAAISEMTRCLALDLAPHGIRVNSVSPGYILTEHQEEKIRSKGMTVEEAQDAWGGLHILKRMGTPKEAAAAIAFLASDDASFITGTDLYVDGGYLAL
jgi:NAD(P)-dependent dehydrogenase (short-subunit alcohol dehydrogenase family)